MTAALLLLKKPSPGAAQGNIAVEMAIVVEQVHVRKAALLAKALKLRRRVPPVVVVALDEELPAGKLGKKAEVGLCLGKSQCPAEVSHDDQGILLAQNAEIFLELLHIACPLAAKDVHGLVGSTQG